MNRMATGFSSHMALSKVVASPKKKHHFDMVACHSMCVNIHSD